MWGPQGHTRVPNLDFLMVLQHRAVLLNSWGPEGREPGLSLPGALPQGTELMAQSRWTDGPGGCPCDSQADAPVAGHSQRTLHTGELRPCSGGRGRWGSTGWRVPSLARQCEGLGSGILGSELGRGRVEPVAQQSGVPCPQSAPRSGWSRTASRTTRSGPLPCCATGWVPSVAG